MALKGVREPVAGIKGVKGPRSLRLPKVPRQSETETSVALGEEYLRKRNLILDLKSKREAMNMALDRDQLVEEHLVEQQLTYLMISMHQKLLAISLPSFIRDLGKSVSPTRRRESAKRSSTKS